MVLSIGCYANNEELVELNNKSESVKDETRTLEPSQIKKHHPNCAFFSIAHSSVSKPFKYLDVCVCAFVRACIYQT